MRVVVITILGMSLCIDLTLSFGAVTIPGLTPAQFRQAFVIHVAKAAGGNRVSMEHLDAGPSIG